VIIFMFPLSATLDFLFHSPDEREWYAAGPRPNPICVQRRWKFASIFFFPSSGSGLFLLPLLAMR